MCTLVSSLILLLEETFSALLYFIRFIHCSFYFISADLGPFLDLFVRNLCTYLCCPLHNKNVK